MDKEKLQKIKAYIDRYLSQPNKYHLDHVDYWLEEMYETIVQQQKDLDFYKHALDMRELQLNKLLGGSK